MIQPLRNVFLVSIDKEADSKIILNSGLELYIDKEFGEQSTTLQQNNEAYNYFRELEAEYSKLHDLWIEASKKNHPSIVPLKRRLMQIEAEQKKGIANKIIKPYSNAIQYGIIRQIPRKVDARVKKVDGAGVAYYQGYFNDVSIEIGDKIYFHHFVGDKENEFDLEGENVYKADMSQVFGVVKQERFVPTEKWIFATPVMEDEADIKMNVGEIILYKKLSAEKKYLLSKIEYCSKQASLAGYKEGDIILHPEFSEYKICIEGKDMYRMHLDDIFCVVNGL